MGKIDPSALLSLSDIFGIQAIFFIFLILVIGLVIAQKPQLFWPLIIVAGIIGCGPRLRGYFLLDELLTAAAVVGASLRCTLIRKKSATGAVRIGNKAHRTMFWVWATFMAAQSIVGVVANNDPRIFRWLIFYLMLSAVVYVTTRRPDEFRFPSLRATSLIIAVSTIALYIAYLAQGIYFEALLGQHGRFLSQDSFWAGSAYAVFPTLVAGPASFFLMRDRSSWVRRLVWAGVAVMMAVAFYYESRISWLVIFACFVIGIRKVRISNIVAFCMLFGVSFALYMPDPVENISQFAADMTEASQALWAPGESDVNRNLQLRVGFMRMWDNPKTFLVGDGIYSHRFTAIPHVTRLYSRYLPNQGNIIPGSRDDTAGMEIFRTVGFTALLIDTGVIGMGLFLALFGLCGVTIARRPSSYRWFQLAVLGMAFMWLLSNNVTDVTLLYLLIIPGGILEQWTDRPPAPEGKTSQKAVAALSP